MKGRSPCPGLLGAQRVSPEDGCHLVGKVGASRGTRARGQCFHPVGDSNDNQLLLGRSERSERAVGFVFTLWERAQTHAGREADCGVLAESTSLTTSVLVSEKG